MRPDTVDCSLDSVFDVSFWTFADYDKVWPHRYTWLLCNSWKQKNVYGDFNYFWVINSNGNFWLIFPWNMMSSFAEFDLIKNTIIIKNTAFDSVQFELKNNKNFKYCNYLIIPFGTPHLSETVLTMSSTTAGSRHFFAGLSANAGDCFPVNEWVASTL